MRKPGTAFTLIELLVVLVVMSLLATLTVLAFSGTMDRYRLSRAVEIVEMFDAFIRREARATQQPQFASIHRRLGELTRAQTAHHPSRTFVLPSRVEIAELRMIDTLGQRVRGGDVTKFGVAASGRTATYALQLRRGNQSRWLVVMGVSGQVVALEEASEVDALLSL